MAALKGKVAVVTGASKGIGSAIAERFAAEGAKVVVNYASDRAGAEKVVMKIKQAGGEGIAVQGDVAKKQDVERIFAETKKAFGTLDILVNNAGVYEFKPLEAIDEPHFRRQFDTNVLGLLYATQAAVKSMNGSGSIINVSSIASKTPPATGSVYAGTKGAVDVITRSLAQELGARKIRINTVAPGFTITEGVKSTGAEQSFGEYAVSRTPLGRPGVPDDIAKAVVFLAGDDSGWITGEEILVGGGIRF
ncbi:MAG TPA: glucose 1-dehydrogenase [Candidatus Acidoferrales bacterium]|nr:glucose 1-dehydrogenase [Candidatus Acidoferrales bacterium]